MKYSNIMTCLPKCIVGKLYLKIIASVQVREMQRVKSQYTSPIVQQLLQSTPIFIVVHQTVFGSALPGHMIQPSLKGFKIFEIHSFRVSDLSFLNKQLQVSSTGIFWPSCLMRSSLRPPTSSDRSLMPSNSSLV